MKTLTFNIPDTLDLDERELTMLLVTRLYELGKLSLGQAAEMAGCTRHSFIEVLGKYNVSLFNYDVNDLENDIRNASSESVMSLKGSFTPPESFDYKELISKSVSEKHFKQ